MKVNFFSLHIGDFLGGTMGMDAQELGAYTSLLIAHYQAGANGLQDDDVFLARVARVSTKVWKRIKMRVLDKFESNQGHWVHARVVDELRKMTELSAQNSEKSLKRWNTPMPSAKQGQSKPLANNHLIYEGKVIRLTEKTFNEWLGMTTMDDKQFALWLDEQDKWLQTLPAEQKAKWVFIVKAQLKKMKAA